MTSATTGVISSKQSWRTGPGIGSRSQDFLLLLLLFFVCLFFVFFWGGLFFVFCFLFCFVFWRFQEYHFHAVISYKLKFCKESPRELNSVSGDWSVRVKAAFNPFNHTNKKLYNLSGRDSGEMFVGRIVSPNVPIVWSLSQFTFFSTHIIFLSCPCSSLTPNCTALHKISSCTVKPYGRHFRSAIRRSTLACLTSRVILGADAQSVTVRVIRGAWWSSSWRKHVLQTLRGSAESDWHWGGQLNQTEWQTQVRYGDLP